jgi:putative ATP-dependent endonuclease of OLD family
MFITSHSPNIASKVGLETVIISKNAEFYPLKQGETLLDDEDYKFLERFLDTTKADLFFAK